jgi:hypothetical protein
MVTFFNNCNNRPHVDLFGREAFFDLNTVGPQANEATDLEAGEICIVASMSIGGEVILSWYRFTRQSVIQDNGHPVRVFFGHCVGSEQLPKAVAAQTVPYTAFFNVDGNFKQQSVPK